MNMMTFSPLFSCVVLSSLWDEPDYVIKVFMTMLALKGNDHVVRLSAYNLAKAARKTEEEVLKALEVLSSPDGKRLEPQPFEGRRIEKVGDGWMILNGEKYQKEMIGCFKRARSAERMRAWRNRKGNTATFGERVAEKEARES